VSCTGVEQLGVVRLEPCIFSHTWNTTKRLSSPDESAEDVEMYPEVTEDKEEREEEEEVREEDNEEEEEQNVEESDDDEAVVVVDDDPAMSTLSRCPYGGDLKIGSGVAWKQSSLSLVLRFFILDKSLLAICKIIQVFELVIFIRIQFPV